MHSIRSYLYELFYQIYIGSRLGRDQGRSYPKPKNLVKHANGNTHHITACPNTYIHDMNTMADRTKTRKSPINVMPKAICSRNIMIFKKYLNFKQCGVRVCATVIQTVFLDTGGNVIIIKKSSQTFKRCPNRVARKFFKHVVQ